jgi:prepilin-type N-terminal cleavage/methylation domain-containing protein
MRTERGYTLFEVMIVVALIATVSGIAIPVFLSSNALNDLWTGSERIGALIRQTRLKAISQNTTYEVRFDCPSAGKMRGLVMTGDPLVDNDANRCNVNSVGDSEIVDMPSGVAFDPAAATGLQVTGRGVFTAVGDAIPLTISVTYGASARYLTVSATGQISFSSTAPEEPEEPEEP